MNTIEERTKHTLTEAMQDMNGGVYGIPQETVAICMSREEVSFLLECMDYMSFDMAWNAGYEHGYKQDVKDVAKRLRGMKWYGGDNKEKRSAGMPEHHA